MKQRAEPARIDAWADEERASLRFCAYPGTALLASPLLFVLVVALPLPDSTAVAAALLVGFFGLVIGLVACCLLFSVIALFHDRPLSDRLSVVGWNGCVCLLAWLLFLLQAR